jgi:hypothetical protein
MRTLLHIAAALPTLLAASQVPPDNPISARDNSVMSAVLDDFVTSEDAAANDPFIQTDPLLFAIRPAQFQLKVSKILPTQAEGWGALTAIQREQATEAAERLAERSDSGGGEFLVDHGRVRLCQGGERTRLLGNPPADAFPPGFSSDGRMAIVILRFPWSIHGGDATYIVAFDKGRWRVVLRHIVRYM